MPPRVFVDGSSGTCGLEIKDRLRGTHELELLEISPELRRDDAERSRLMNEADLVILCLPDDAARHAVTLVTNPSTRIIDASTAHRTDPAWTYGMPELGGGQRERIADARLVANPGCHASGFIACVAPLVQAGIVPSDIDLTCFSLTGYTGGGKQMIADYEADKRPLELDSPRAYGLGMSHKHLPEMRTITGLDHEPAFVPVVADFPRGMLTSVTLTNAALPNNPTTNAIREALLAHYAGEKIVRVEAADDAPAMAAANVLANTDGMLIRVTGNDTHTCVSATFDNLGKGAAGAAVQNMNVMLGLDELTGLHLTKRS